MGLKFEVSQFKSFGNVADIVSCARHHILMIASVGHSAGTCMKGGEGISVCAGHSNYLAETL